MSEKPEALRLADLLCKGNECCDFQAAAEMRRLHAENEALRADAERYRWLRENSYLWPTEDAIYADEQVEPVALWHTKPMTTKGIDAAIDAARSKI